MLARACLVSAQSEYCGLKTLQCTKSDGSKVLGVQVEMLARAREAFDACIEKATTWEDFMVALERKHMVLAPW